jgi:hypothetical protein
MFGVAQLAAPALDTAARAAAGPIVLKPQTSPMGKLIGAIFICLFWNGIVGAFTYFEIQAFRESDGGWFLAAFLLLFQIIGVALILNVPYQILALANPRPTLTLSSRTVPVGGTLSLEWQLSGAAQRVRHLKLVLQGREEARYRRGTRTSTDTNVFYNEPIVEVTDPMAVGRGSTTIRVPAETMHTFESRNNKVLWRIQLVGAIARWPDVDEAFDITVTPK